jgi:hypothetical protein
MVVKRKKSRKTKKEEVKNKGERLKVRKCTAPPCTLNFGHAIQPLPVVINFRAEDVVVERIRHNG